MLSPLLSLFLIIFILFLPGLAIADEPETDHIFPQIGRFYVYLGDFEAGITPNELENPGSDFALGLGLLFEQTQSFVWGLDVVSLYVRYDTPSTVSGGPFTVVSDDMSLSTLGLSVSGRYDYVVDRVRLYVGAAAGLYMSKLTLSGSTLGFIGTYEEQSNDIGFSYFYGLMFALTGADYLGFEYRHLALDVNLAPVTSGTVDVGGGLVLLIYAYTF